MQKDKVGVLIRSIALVLVFAVTSARPAMAADTPTLANNGDCWQPNTNLWCRNAWPGRNKLIYFRAIDRFSGQYPAWLAPARAAVSAWNSAPGPQLYSFTAHSGDTWVYLWYAYTGQHGLVSPAQVAVTYNCDSSGCYSDSTRPGIYQWSDIYFNADAMPRESPAQQQNAFAHESGHAMGLWHNPSSNTLMYWAITTIGGPTSSDIGHKPGCQSGGHGVNCVFGWGD